MRNALTNRPKNVPPDLVPVQQVHDDQLGSVHVYAPDDDGPGWNRLLRVTERPTMRWVRTRGALLGVLAVQSFLTLRAVNSAFQDEALYLYAGHREIALLLHGTPTFDNYSSYFSGSPFLYPVLAGALDGVGGLAAVRAASLLFMLATTVLVYALTSRLFSSQAAILAAIVFAVAEPTLFMGHLATYDAGALCLLALAAWLAVRSARHALLSVLWAAPCLVLAAGAKYASLLFVPTVIALAALAAVRERGWMHAIFRGVTLAAATGALAVAALAAAPNLRAGITSTTSSRALGADSVMTVVRDSAAYIGGAFLLAAIGLVLYAQRPGQLASTPSPSRSVRIWLGIVLTTTSLLAPLDQAHLHTITSLQKHVGYGLLFAAPMAGFALSRLLGRRVVNRQRICLVLAACLLLTWGGISQANARTHDWPNSDKLIEAMRTQVRPVTGRYLVEESEVPRYYLRDLTQPYQWTGTYYFEYKTTSGQQLTGVPAYRAAIADRYFDLVVLRYGPTAALDVQIDAQLRAQNGYQLISRLPASSSYGDGTWMMWRRS